MGMRQSYGRLASTLRFPILLIQYLYIEPGPPGIPVLDWMATQVANWHNSSILVKGNTRNSPDDSWTLLVSECTPIHYGDVIMRAMASQITNISKVCSTICSGADQRKHQRSTSLAFVKGIHWSPVNFPHKGPVTWKVFPCDDLSCDTSYPSIHSYPFWDKGAVHVPFNGVGSTSQWWIPALHESVLCHCCNPLSQQRFPIRLNMVIESVRPLNLPFRPFPM